MHVFDRFVVCTVFAFGSVIAGRRCVDRRSRQRFDYSHTQICGQLIVFFFVFDVGSVVGNGMASPRHLYTHFGGFHEVAREVQICVL